MHKNLFFCMLMAGLFSLYACKKKKNKPDSIELIGPSLIYLCGSNGNEDPGANVLNSNGDIIEKASSNWYTQVNFNAFGTYFVTYKAKGEGNDDIQVVRAVRISMMKDCYIGDYNCKWIIPGTTDTLTTSTVITNYDITNKVTIVNLGDIGTFTTTIKGQFGDSLYHYYLSPSSSLWNETLLIGNTKNFGKTIEFYYKLSSQSGSVDFEKRYILTKK